MRKSLGAVVTIAAALLVTSEWRYGSSLSQARERHREDLHDQTLVVARDVERCLQDLYTGLRTIARLPGVRGIERHGANFAGDARTTVQELYNNLAASVSMSEVYIVPRTLDPERIDPVTGEPEAPIVTFDALIIDRSAADDAEDAGDEHEELEETEIFEYRLMVKQLAWFAAHTPDASSCKGLDLPMLTGPQVITCDNSRFDPAHPDDADRSGVICSVPFFGLDGEFAGMVSGIVLTHALSDLLPEGRHALRVSMHELTAGSHQDGIWRQHADAIAAGEPASSLIYSEVTPLRTADRQATWTLWSGAPDAAFWARADVAEARLLRWGFGGAVLLVAVAALWSRRRAIRRRAESERAAAAGVERAVASTEEVAGTISSITHRMAGTNQELTASADCTASEAHTVNDVAADVRENINTVVNSVRELGTSIGGIADSTAQMAHVASQAADSTDAVVANIDGLDDSVGRIRNVVQLIESIAFQTNLLALNAAVEAARAGDAGRGFAVVAHEVKALATRTSAATGQIAQEMGEIQRRTSEVVRSVKAICETIHDIRGGQTTIAATVEEQHAVGRQMSEALERTTALVDGIARRIDALVGLAAGTRSSARESEADVRQLVTMVETLQAVRQQLLQG
ncbi:MAG: hypothetical protein H6835_06770 [Planctomycetes bacterium]|nr:hypothetical protein [Planctomycetota bacterium]